ncbi:MAG: hypothetical protein SGI89_02325 [bacterium]|nr:hypothetical protein [bacterium]
MMDYIVEFTWNDVTKLTFVIVSEIKNVEELTVLSDELYESYLKRCMDINLYFFGTKDSAIKYVYQRFVEAGSWNKAIQNTDCLGHLLDYKLTSLFPAPKILKTYSYLDFPNCSLGIKF